MYRAINKIIDILSIELTSKTPTPIAIPATKSVFESKNSMNVALQPFWYIADVVQLSPLFKPQHEGGMALPLYVQSLGPFSPQHCN